MEELTHFLTQYEIATNSHDFDVVAPLLADTVVYWFSDGSFEGSDAIRTAFEKTWATIQNEVYAITDVRWVAISDTAATCIYEFKWQGDIDGVHKSGYGRGTNAMIKTADGWKMAHEHLSRYPA
jgi:ketosteroid isomerase-like protein